MDGNGTKVKVIRTRPRKTWEQERLEEQRKLQEKKLKIKQRTKRDTDNS